MVTIQFYFFLLLLLLFLTVTAARSRRNETPTLAQDSRNLLGNIGARPPTPMPMAAIHVHLPPKASPSGGTSAPAPVPVPLPADSQVVDGQVADVQYTNSSTPTSTSSTHHLLNVHTAEGAIILSLLSLVVVLLLCLFGLLSYYNYSLRMRLKSEEEKALVTPTRLSSAAAATNPTAPRDVESSLAAHSLVVDDVEVRERLVGGV